MEIVTSGSDANEGSVQRVEFRHNRLSVLNGMSLDQLDDLVKALNDGRFDLAEALSQNVQSLYNLSLWDKGKNLFRWEDSTLKPDIAATRAYQNSMAVITADTASQRVRNIHAGITA